MKGYTRTSGSSGAIIRLLGLRLATHQLVPISVSLTRDRNKCSRTEPHIQNMTVLARAPGISVSGKN